MTFSKWTTGMALAVLLSVPAASAQPQDKAEVAFRAAMEKETVEGDLKGAIDQYRKLAQGKDRAVAARALVRMGQCYEKLGDAESRKAYERVVREFGDQKDAAAAAGARLAALGKPGSGPSTRLIAKNVWVAGPSPDGRFLLQEGTDDLEVRDLQTGQTRHIAKKYWNSAAVSPDGRQVAIVQRTGNGRELRIIGADNSAERVLWHENNVRAWSLQWSPDGKRIIFAVGQGRDRNRLIAISATDGTVTTLFEGKELNNPQLSPDGRWVVDTRRVRNDPAADNLWLLQLEDRSETLLFEGQSYVGDPRWTPDGAGVVFLSDRRVPGTTLDLWFLRTSGGKPLGFPELLKTDLGEMFEGYPSAEAQGPITRDGAFYFHREPVGEMIQLLTTKFDPDTGKVVGAPSFVSRKGGLSRSPSFSRDGKWLAYVSHHNSLVIQSVESGDERIVPMSPSPALINWAVIFPDGRSVLVLAMHPKHGDGIYRVDAASGAWTSLKKPGEHEVGGWPNGISPNGRTIYLSRYPADGVHLIARDIETGQERELKSWKGRGAWGLSPDGSKIAVAHSDAKDLVIDVLPAAGGPSREVYRAQGFQTSDVWWTPDGRYLLFSPADKLAHAKAIMRLPVEGGEAQPIGIFASQDGQVQFPRGLGAGPVHPNGRQLVYVARGEDSEGENWVLENFLPKAAK